MFFEKYFQDINKGLDSIDTSKLESLAGFFISASKKGKKVIFVGNGGSASIAGHLTVDCINAVGIKAVNFNDSGIITCFSNDYGYENWVSKALDCYADSGDVLVLISSSGQSKNNPLRKLGDINLWIDSNKYNIVEMTHHIWLLAAVDYIIMNNKE
jgi:D-sedoheptulose 7-phosphate isomerase